MNDKMKILLVEDENAIRHFITTILNSNDYLVLQAINAEEAVNIAESQTPDLILLDLGLPDMDGVEVLRKIREWSEVPIIVVSARKDENEKVAALDAGANDYVTKPFGNSELLARIRTALRQYTKLKENMGTPDKSFLVGRLKIDYVRRLVTVEDKPIHFTPIEYRILVLLSRSAGKVLTHEHIISEIWGPFGSDSQVLRVNMANIRRKIEPNPADPRYILTEIGVGYRISES